MQIEDEVEEEPQEGDFIIFSCGYLGSNTGVSIVGGSSVIFSGEESETGAYGYIRRLMRRDTFYPGVWRESDHGNMYAVDVWKEE